MSSKNITYYFPDTKVATGFKLFKEQGTSLTGFYFTKSNIPLVTKENYSDNYAIYFLFDDVGDGKPSVYVGQSTNGVYRIKDHVRTKAFWNYCIMIVSDNNSFDKSAIDYLEFHFINRFKSTVYNLENKEPRTQTPTIDRFIRSTYDNYIEQIHFLLEANGIDFRDEQQDLNENKKYFNATLGRDAKLFIHDGKFYVAQGSVIVRPKEQVKTWQDGGKFYQFYTDKFLQLVESNQAELLSDNRSAKLLVDVAFTAPSGAAEIVTGNSTNGWNFWEDLEKIRK